MSPLHAGRKGPKGKGLRTTGPKVADHLPTAAPDLAEVSAAWPTLPGPIRAAILALVRAPR